jgi:hypothetical protein
VVVVDRQSLDLAVARLAFRLPANRAQTALCFNHLGVARGRDAESALAFLGAQLLPTYLAIRPLVRGPALPRGMIMSSIYRKPFDQILDSTIINITVQKLQTVRHNTVNPKPSQSTGLIDATPNLDDSMSRRSRRPSSTACLDSFPSADPREVAGLWVVIQAALQVLKIDFVRHDPGSFLGEP